MHREWNKLFYMHLKFYKNWLPKFNKTYQKQKGYEQ
jgi:hypothetical protein